MGGGGAGSHLDLLHQLADHLFEFVDELVGVVLVGLDLAQAFLPLAGEFGRFEELVLDGGNEVEAGVGGDEGLAFFGDVVALEEGFDDGGAGGGAADAVFFEGVAQLVVGDGLAGCFHGAEQGGLGVGLGGLGPFFGQGGGVGAVLAFDEGGEGLLVVVAAVAVVVGGGFFGGMAPGHDVAPALLEDLLAGGFEFELAFLGFAGGGSLLGFDTAGDGGGGEFAVGVEDGYEAAGYEVEDFFLVEGEVAVGGVDAGGYDGVVVGDFGGVEHLFALFEGGAHKGLDEGGIGQEALEDAGAFGIDVVGEVGGIDTGVGGDLFLVEALDVFEGFVGREGEFFVAFDLEAGEVEEAEGGFGAGFFDYAGDFEVAVADALQGAAAFFLVGDAATAVGGGVVVGLFLLEGEEGVAVDGGEDPVLLGLEVLDFELAVDDHGQGGGLHTAYGEHLALLLAEAEGVEAGGVHAEEPVADGTAEAGFVERLVFFLGFEVGKAFADGLVGHGVDPEALDGACGLSALHDPALDELTLLSGIAAVDDAFGVFHEALDGVELLLVAVVLDEFDAEAVGDHGQVVEVPRPPPGGVVVGFFEGAEVAEGPGDLVAVALHIAIVRDIGTQYACNVAPNRRFFSDTEDHFFEWKVESGKWKVFSSGKFF